jgi:Ca2+-binding EF-hand superfamily protein
MSQIEEVMKQELVANTIRRQTKVKANDEEASGPLRMTQAKLKSIFSLFDADDTGMLLVNDLDLILRALGVEIDEDSQNAFLDKAEKMGPDGRITYEQFNELLETVATKKDTEAEARRMFAVLSKDGVIDAATLKAALSSSEARVNDDEIAEVLKYCDVDADGQLTEKDFVAVLAFVNDMKL